MNKNKGITLIALVITIVILLILAAVTLNLVLGKNGIINKAKDSKIQIEIADEKEKIELAVSYIKIDKEQKYDNSSISVDELQKSMDREKGEGKTTVRKELNLIVRYIDSQREYEVNPDGSLTEPEDISKIEDEKPGEMEGDGTEGNPYVINSIEDLVAFSNQVNGGNSFQGKFIALGNDLSFTSNNSYIDANRKDFGDINKDGVIDTLKIELTTKSGFAAIGQGFDEINGTDIFKGIFDGRENKIKNLIAENAVKKEPYESKELSLFCINEGTIQNLVIENIKLTADISYNVAGICIYNTGKIQNCKIQGIIDVNTEENNVGGICYKNEGDIIFCQNKATATLKSNYGSILGGICYTNTGTIQKSSNVGNININTIQPTDQTFQARARMAYSAMAGGIVYENENEIERGGKAGIIEECYNTGNIYTNSYEWAEGAGISIRNYGKIGYCYNTGNISATGTNNDNASGINIDSWKTGNSISNCYNVGEIENSCINKENKYDYSYNLGISVIYQGEIENSYYLNGTALKGAVDRENDNILDDTIYVKGESEMKDILFVQLLNTRNPIEIYKKDTGINNGYPIFIWQ